MPVSLLNHLKQIDLPHEISNGRTWKDINLSNGGKQWKRDLAGSRTAGTTPIAVGVGSSETLW